MKKILILTSAVALSACFGGGDSGTGGSSYVAPRAAILPGSAAASSNEKVTSMVSEILVGHSGNRAPLVGRSATTSYNGNTYTSYRLEDVKFKFVGEENATLKFDIDENGKIISAGRYEKDVLSGEGTFFRSGDDSNAFGGSNTQYAWAAPIDSTGLADYIALHPENIPEGKTASGVAAIISQHFGSKVQVADHNELTPQQVKDALKNEIAKELNKTLQSQKNEADRTALAAAFNAAYDYYADQIPNSGIAPQIVNVKVDIYKADAGLKFADFGTAYMRKADASGNVKMESTYAPYYGGYDVLKVDPDAVANGTIFTGKAVAGIDHTTNTNGQKYKEGVLVGTEDAQLTLNHDGSSSLVMENLIVQEADKDTLLGKKWHNLTVQTDSDKVPTFIISGENQIATAGYGLPNLPSDGTVAFEGTDYKAEDHEYIKNVGTDGVGYRQAGYMETTVYGLNGTPEEAISRFSFSDGTYDHNDNESVSVYGAFGGGLAPTE